MTGFLRGFDCTFSTRTDDLLSFHLVSPHPPRLPPKQSRPSPSLHPHRPRRPNRGPPLPSIPHLQALIKCVGEPARPDPAHIQALLGAHGAAPAPTEHQRRQRQGEASAGDQEPRDGPLAREHAQNQYVHLSFCRLLLTSASRTFSIPFLLAFNPNLPLI